MRLPENAKQPAGQPKDAVQPLTEEELGKVAGGHLEPVRCQDCGYMYSPSWPGEPCPKCSPEKTHIRP